MFLSHYSAVVLQQCSVDRNGASFGYSDAFDTIRGVAKTSHSFPCLKPSSLERTKHFLGCQSYHGHTLA